ncbi:signal peptide peptidase [Trifolium repens]|nr:signal peptide peptidase [Trifolium repens]KAK2457693.1 signal peptide peptidase [Trifolium repens]
MVAAEKTKKTHESINNRLILVMKSGKYTLGYKTVLKSLRSSKDEGVSGIVNMNAKAAVLFVLVASCFLFMLYKLMLSWFLELLVVLFCIGGIEGLQTCLVAVLSRWFKNASESYIKLPFIGAVSYLTLAVTPFCITFAVFWAVYRDKSFAWIGQGILGIALIITVLKIVHVPNLKVGTVLLSCSLIYDLFWVFVSKRFFNESVMIVVARGDRSGEDGIPMYDWLAKKSLVSGYFLWAMFAYGFGLLITYVALNLMDRHGQPALLYIVPFTLGTILALGRKRGELKIFWRMANQKDSAHMADILIIGTKANFNCLAQEFYETVTLSSK